MSNHSHCNTVPAWRRAATRPLLVMLLFTTMIVASANATTTYTSPDSLTLNGLSFNEPVLITDPTGQLTIKFCTFHSSLTIISTTAALPHHTLPMLLQDSTFHGAVNVSGFVFTAGSYLRVRDNTFVYSTTENLRFSNAYFFNGSSFIFFRNVVNRTTTEIASISAASVDGQIRVQNNNFTGSLSVTSCTVHSHADLLLDNLNVAGVTSLTGITVSATARLVIKRSTFASLFELRGQSSFSSSCSLLVINNVFQDDVEFVGVEISALSLVEVANSAVAKVLLVKNCDFASGTSFSISTSKIETGIKWVNTDVGEAGASQRSTIIIQEVVVPSGSSAAFDFVSGKFYATDFSVSFCTLEATGIGLQISETVKFYESSIFTLSDNTLVGGYSAWYLHSRMFDGSHVVIPSGNFGVMDGLVSLYLEQSEPLQLANSFSPHMELVIEGAQALELINITLHSISVSNSQFSSTTVTIQSIVTTRESTLPWTWFVGCTFTNATLRIASTTSNTLTLIALDFATGSGLTIDDSTFTSSVLLSSNSFRSGSSLSVLRGGFLGLLSVVDSTFVDASASFEGNTIVTSSASTAAIYFKNSPLNGSSTVAYVNNTIVLNETATSVAVLHDSDSECEVSETITFSDNVFEVIDNGVTATATVDVPLSCSLCPSGSCPSGRSAAVQSLESAVEHSVPHSKSGDARVAILPFAAAGGMIALLVVMTLVVVRFRRLSSKSSVRIHVGWLEAQVCGGQIDNGTSSAYMEVKPQEAVNSAEMSV